jgi:hypothetical protein
VFTRALHWSVSWGRSNQSTSSHPIYIRSILILSSYVCVGLPLGLLHLFEPKLCKYFSSLLYQLHAPLISYAWFGHSNYVLQEIQILKPLILQLSAEPCCFSLFGPNIFSLHIEYLTRHGQHRKHRAQQHVGTCLLSRFLATPGGGGTQKDAVTWSRKPSIMFSEKQSMLKTRWTDLSPSGLNGDIWRRPHEVRL